MTKVYDAEETRDEIAKRLLGTYIQRQQEASHKLRDKLRRHARHLSAGDRLAAIEFLRRDGHLTVGLLEDAGEELPEFGWPSDSIDREWDLS